MALKPINLVIVISFLFYCSCGPKQRLSTRSDTINAESENSELEERKGTEFSGDDIESIESLPSKPEAQPWSVLKVYAVGTFPDESQASIPSDVKWKLLDQQADVIFDEISGEFAAKKELSAKVKMSFKKLSEEIVISFKFSKNSLLKTISDPVQFSATRSSESNSVANLSWKSSFAAGSGFRLVWADADPAPAEGCEAADGQFLVTENVLGPTNKTFKVEGLNPSKSYKFRICTIQALELGGKSIERISQGATAQLNAIP